MQRDRVGPYELVERIGAGGMAETFVAIRRGPAGFEQRVCLKRILPGRTSDPWFVGPFLDEARLLAHMRCANIVQVYDFGESAGAYYMALELVDGADLEGLLRGARERREPLPLDACLYIAAELLAALSYAHGLVVEGAPLNIIHRDISPSNVLLSSHGEVKLTDFGIAKARGRAHKTDTGLIKGKLAYMSPEQVRGESLDQRTDLFSAGVLLYELFTGEHPFEAAADVAVVHNIVSGNRLPIRERAPDLPSEVCDLVEALLELSPLRRPASAAAALRMISSRVLFVAGQQLLSERVSRHVVARAELRARSIQVTEPAEGPYYSAPEVSADLPQATSTIESDEQTGGSARAAKDTTARRRWTATSRSRSVPYWAAALGAGFGSVAVLGAWLLLRPTERAEVVTSAVVTTANAQVVVADSGTPRAAALPNDQGPAANEQKTSSTTQQVEPLALQPGSDAPPTAPMTTIRAPVRARSKELRLSSTPSRDAGAVTAVEAGARRGRWTEVTPEQF